MPHPHLARAEASVLVIIDVQEPFARAMVDRASLVSNISTLIHVARVLDIPVVVTEQNNQRLGPTVTELTALLKGHGGYEPIDKMSFSCCAVESFVQRVYDLGRDTLIVTGMEAHVCVQQTVLDALSLGYKSHVVRDAVTCRKREDWDAAMEKLRHAGAVISTTEMAAYELLGRAGTPQFKAAMEYLKW